MTGLVAPIASDRLQRLGGRTWVATAGPLLRDAAAARFASLVDTALEDGCLELVLDLTAVTELDSTGAIALCEIEIALTEAGAEVAVAAVTPPVLTTLRATQLDLVWRIEPDRRRALAELLSAPI
jgi:anti-anti-sigma factor